MKKFKIVMSCCDTSEVEVEAESIEEVEQEMSFSNKIWDEAYPNSVHQCSENYEIYEV